MVNVNQPLPFNLYGRPPHARLDRSLSANTTPPRASSSTAQDDQAPQSSTAAGNTHLPRMPSQSTSREPSPSIQTSRSTSSLHPGDASYLPPEADPEGGNRRPILNVRLVRGPGGFFAGARPRPGPMTRGRPGRPSEERARENGEEAGAPGSTDGKGKAVANGVNGTSDTPSSTTAEAHDHVDSSDEAAAAARNGNGTHTHADATAAAQGPGSSGSDSEFKIEDVGDIAQSWGD
ncbi:hypothetical protein TRAPUB_8554 [Trametes pubescens]|uniref:Uncharacterized protein n=1 Tax=Trametes pubescens TaxID=154538 RepID=A0A1M2W542_TRAPU|nr:hypothetical protein TRAPUB_8554 [Trametes pubescens]